MSDGPLDPWEPETPLPAWLQPHPAEIVHDRAAVYDDPQYSIVDTWGVGDTTYIRADMPGHDTASLWVERHGETRMILSGDDVDAGWSRLTDPAAAHDLYAQLHREAHLVDHLGQVAVDREWQHDRAKYQDSVDDARYDLAQGDSSPEQYRTRIAGLRGWAERLAYEDEAARTREAERAIDDGILDRYQADLDRDALTAHDPPAPDLDLDDDLDL